MSPQAAGEGVVHGGQWYPPQGDHAAGWQEAAAAGYGGMAGDHAAWQASSMWAGGCWPAGGGSYWPEGGDQAWAGGAASGWGAGYWGGAQKAGNSSSSGAARRSGLMEAPPTMPKKPKEKKVQKQEKVHDNSEEHTAQVHFTKTYGVLTEVLSQYPKAFQNVGAFLDLGCAPGGFSCRLLEEYQECKGVGLTLPMEEGGFPVLLAHDRFTLQPCNLMTVTPEEVDQWTEACGLVDVCMADAQDLGRRTTRQKGDGKGAGKGKEGGKAAKSSAAAPAGSKDVGVQAACHVLGIWAMTLQEVVLSHTRLKEGGTFFFRFGWRGKLSNEELWYREASFRLLSFLFAHFEKVSPFKSEFSHQADSCFYVVAAGFRREAYLAEDIQGTLQGMITSIMTCEKPSDLPELMEALQKYVTPEREQGIEDMLDIVGRLRAIGMSTRQGLEAQRDNPEAALWISPVPLALTTPLVRERLERYGKISHIKRRAHPIGVGADALIQFVQPAHCTSALDAITNHLVLGPGVTAKRLCEVKGAK